MRKRKKDAAETLFGIMQETEALAEEQPSNDINALNDLLAQFLSQDKIADNLDKQTIKRAWLNGAALIGVNGIRRKLAAIDLEFFGRAYFPHYFSRPSPDFHRELDAIWQEGVLKSGNPFSLAVAKQINRSSGVRRVVAAPRGHAKSTNLTFKGTMHAVLYGYKHYPIILSDSSEQAEGFLDNLRVEFEENEAIIEDFGLLAGKVWRSNVLLTRSNIKIEAIGSGKKKIGRASCRERV